MADSRNRTKKDDFLVQGAILAIAAVVVKIIGVLYRIPLTNILGDEGNGYYGYAYEVYAMTLMLSSFSLPIAVSKLVSARMATGQRKNAFRVFLCSIVFAAVIGILASVGIFFGADFISANMMESPFSAYALRVLAVGLFTVAVLGVLRGYFQGLGTMIPTAVSQIIEQITNAAIGLTGAGVMIKIGAKAAEKAGEELLEPAYGAAGATLGTVVGSVFALLFLLFTVYTYRTTIRRQMRRDTRHRKESYARLLKILVLTTIPVVFSTAIYNINQILDMTIFNKIMAMQGYTEKEYMALLGIFTGKYNTLINVPLAMANGLAASVIPSLTAAYTERNKPLIHDKIAQSTRLTMLIAIPCFVGFLVLGSPLMVFLYNDHNETPARLLAIGAVTVVLYGWSTVMNSILQGINKMTAPAKNAAVSLVIHLISLVIMMLLKLNIYAVVLSNIVFSLSMCILDLRSIRKACGYRQEWNKTIVKPLIASGIMGVVTFLVQQVLDVAIGGRFVATGIAIITAVLVYAVLILKLGALSEEDILALPQGRRIYRISRKLRLLPEKRNILSE